MSRILTARWTYIAIRAIGFSALVGYLSLTGDWRLSAAWALAFPVISFSIAWVFVILKLFDRFPMLNRYVLYPHSDSAPPRSEDDWVWRQATYLESGFRGKAIIFTPAEDGFICVPILLVGTGVMTASVGGVVFGFIHLGRFTYLECIGKAVSYALVCYVVLPHGLVTVALGHFITDALGLLGLKVATHRLSRGAGV